MAKVQVEMDHKKGKWCVVTIVGGDPVKRYWNSKLNSVIEEASIWGRLYQAEVTYSWE